MKLLFKDFEKNKVIDEIHSNNGGNYSPEIYFDEIPQGTKSLVLIFEDPNAIRDIAYHWIVYNINPNTKKISENQFSDFNIGVNDFGNQGYNGPSIENGFNDYIFTLYAVKDTINTNKKLKGEDVLHFIKDKIIDKTEITLRYKK